MQVQSEDARWLARWMRGNLCGVLIISGLLWMLGNDAPQPTARGSAADERVDLSSTERFPTGWRRTANGWENASNWAPPPKRLGELIVAQQSREPQWAQRALSELQELPPLVFALCQVTAITAVFVLTPQHRKTMSKR